MKRALLVSVIAVLTHGVSAIASRPGVAAETPGTRDHFRKYVEGRFALTNGQMVAIARILNPTKRWSKRHPVFVQGTVVQVVGEGKVLVASPIEEVASSGGMPSAWRRPVILLTNDESSFSEGQGVSLWALHEADFSCTNDRGHTNLVSGYRTPVPCAMTFKQYEEASASGVQMSNGIHRIVACTSVPSEDQTTGKNGRVTAIASRSGYAARRAERSRQAVRRRDAERARRLSPEVHRQHAEENSKTTPASDGPQPPLKQPSPSEEGDSGGAGGLPTAHGEQATNGSPPSTDAAPPGAAAAAPTIRSRVGQTEAQLQEVYGPGRLTLALPLAPPFATSSHKLVQPDAKAFRKDGVQITVYFFRNESGERIAGEIIYILPAAIIADPEASRTVAMKIIEANAGEHEWVAAEAKTKGGRLSFTRPGARAMYIPSPAISLVVVSLDSFSSYVEREMVRQKEAAKEKAKSFGGF